MDARRSRFGGLFGGWAAIFALQYMLLLGLSVVGRLVEGGTPGVSNVGPFCAKFQQIVGGDIASCCQALAIANGQRCFCGTTPRDWFLESAEICGLEIYASRSLECTLLRGRSDNSVLVANTWKCNLDTSGM